MSWFPCLVRSSTGGGEARFALGDPLVDSYLAFVAGRARANTLRAVAHDLKTFFGVVDKDPGRGRRGGCVRLPRPSAR
jgi:integrase/recombinase XerD